MLFQNSRGDCLSRSALRPFKQKSLQPILRPFFLIAADQIADIFTYGPESAALDLFLDLGFHRVRERDVHCGGHGNCAPAIWFFFRLRSMTKIVNLCQSKRYFSLDRSSRVNHGSTCISATTVQRHWERSFMQPCALSMALSAARPRTHACTSHCPRK